MSSQAKDKNKISKILVIDDDTYICELLTNYLKGKEYDVDKSFNGKSALKLIGETNYDLVLCDYRLPDLNGYDVLKKIKERNLPTEVIIMTAYSDIKMAVKLIKNGAIDYVSKPIQPEEILQSINKALTKKTPAVAKNELKDEFIIGEDNQIQQVMAYTDAVGPTNITVLIEGETGSGKEYLARVIHQKSERNNERFMAVDCGALPKELANSELFGHIKGSFTGAINDKSGYFEQANGGTLFLDEVGNLPHENQVKLLRAIQENVINRVGDTKLIPIDVRIIAATNDDLFSMVEKGQFREDLYHRINGFKIKLPSLRERKNDIFIFADKFLDEANKSFNKNISGFSEEVQEIFKKYPWYGNIRELKNVVNRCVLLEQSNEISASALPEEIINSSSFRKGFENNILNTNEITDLKEATNIAEKNMIINVLKETNYNKTQAAKRLKIDRKTLYNKINDYNIQLNY